MVHSFILSYACAIATIMLAALISAGCDSPDSAPPSQGLRAMALDLALAKRSPGVAVALALANHSKTQACALSEIPKAYRESSAHTSNDAEKRYYLKLLDRLYTEERAFCEVLGRAAEETQSISDHLMTSGELKREPLYMLYATPRGVLRGVRQLNHEADQRSDVTSLESGLPIGQWLDFEIADAGELAIGLFESAASCSRAETHLENAGIDTRPCRDWRSEPLYRITL